MICPLTFISYTETTHSSELFVDRFFNKLGNHKAALAEYIVTHIPRGLWSVNPIDLTECHFIVVHVNMESGNKPHRQSLNQSGMALHHGDPVIMSTVNYIQQHTSWTYPPYQSQTNHLRMC